jgi:hypothetical protein
VGEKKGSGDAAFYQRYEYGGECQCVSGDRWGVDFGNDSMEQQAGGKCFAAIQHWYRQNADGKWSHKRGKTRVTNADETIYSNPITDPEGASETLGYTIFVGYFAVSPWNNLWSNATTSSSMAEITNISANVDGTISQAQANNIEIGMSIDEVVDILGFAGADIGSGTIVHEYLLENGEDLIIACSMDSTGVFIVTHIINSENTEV